MVPGYHQRRDATGTSHDEPDDVREIRNRENGTTRDQGKHVQNGTRSYDGGLERLLDKVAGEREGLSDAEVAQTLAEGGIRSINRRLNNAFAALRGERLAEGMALRRQGPARHRRWLAGEQIGRALAALRRAHWSHRSKTANYVRAAQEIPGASARFRLEVRTMRVATRVIRFDDGIEGLRERIDTVRIDRSGKERRSEVHVEQWIDRESEMLFDTTPEPGLEWSGERVRGMEEPDPFRGTWRGNEDRAVVAEIAEGLWMSRWVACEDDPEELVQRIAGEPVRWEEWSTAEGMPIERYVLRIVDAKDAHRPVPHMEWNAPPDLRYRAWITPVVVGADRRTHVLAPVEARRNEEWIAADRALSEGAARDEIGWGGHAAGAFYGEDGTSVRHFASRQIRIPPAMRAREALRWPEGNYALPGPSGEDGLAERADYLHEAGWIENALEAHRRRVQLRPWDLSAMEDLAIAHSSLGHYDEYDALRNEIVRRGLAMLPPGFNWEENALPWGTIENRPFLRAYFHQATKEEERGSHGTAKAMWARLEHVSARDAMGTRYEVLRMAVKLEEWNEAGAIVDRLEEEAHAEVEFARVLCLHALDRRREAESAMDDAAEAYPIVASRIMQHERGPGRGKWDGYTVGSYSEAERYWTRYAPAWTGRSGPDLRAMLARARERSSRRHRVRRSRSIFCDVDAIDASMARAREAVAELERASVRHCDEIWDLLHHVEDGTDSRTFGAACNELTVRWESAEDETFEIQLKGQWEGIVTTMSVEGTTDIERMTFEQIAQRRHRKAPI